jgi:spermidine synthase
VFGLPLLVLLFASGTAALIYELVWFYLVELVVGASSFSVAALLASFMGGMALGSLLAPKLPRSWHPLRVVAGLESGIALIGAAMPFAMPLVQEWYVSLARVGLSGPLMRAGVCALVLLPPTILMGATLPTIAPAIGGGREGASRMGLLYMANIAGGATGTLLAGFYLLRVFDTVVASAAGVALNAAGAVLAWHLAGGSAAPTLPQTGPAGDGAEEESPKTAGSSPGSVYVVTALSGLTALGAEVVWTRQLSLLFGASVYTFSLILAVFLIGLGAGSFAGSSIARRIRTPAVALGLCQLLLALAIGLGAWTIVHVLPQWQPSATYLPRVWFTPAWHFLYDALRCAVALLPATLLWGASFPLAIAAASGADTPARVVARVTAMNTIGALVGAIGFTIVGMPMAGSQGSQQALVVAAAVSAALILWPATRARWAAAAVAVLATTAASVALVPPVPSALIAYGRSVGSWGSIRRVLYLAEGATASVAVTEGSGGAKQFHIAGKVEASDMDTDMRLERMLGHIPALLHPRPRSILIVGVGAGVTAGALVVHPEVERIVVCEIEPVVPQSARRWFAEENHHVFDDPRVRLVYDDARHFLQTTPEKFDIITSDPVHPWVRGAATLYSLEYLQLVRGHLNPGGVVTQWIPLYETDTASVKSEIGTFAQVFPDTTLWNPDLLEEGYDLVALGRVRTEPISEAAIAERLRQSPAVQQSLAQVALGTAKSLIETYAGRSQDLAPWLQDAQINRERHLRLQYLAGLAASFDERYAIFQAILQYRRYPADFFVMSAGTEAELRAWYARAPAPP